MKKITIFTAALALMASASCMKEAIAPETIEGDGFSFTASRADFGTKTQLVDGCKVEWKAGNQVNIFNEKIGKDAPDEASALFNEEAWKTGMYFKTEKAGSSALFKCTDATFSLEQGLEYLLLHPAGGNYYSLCAGEDRYIRFWFGDQDATLGTYQETYGYCAAKASDFSKPVVFKNLLPLLKFTVPASIDGRITKITVTSNNPTVDGYVAGNMICDYTGDTPVVKVFSEFKAEYAYKKGNSSVSLTSAGMAAGDYYLAIAPKTYSKGLKITVTYKDGKTSTRSSSASVDLESGVIYDMGTVGAENYDGYGVTLPYVFSLFATNGTGNTPKYITKKVVTDKTLVQYNEASTGAMLEVKTSGSYNDYWSNKWYGQDNFVCQYFTGPETYFMLNLPLRTSLPSAFRVSFGFFVDGTKNDIIKDWKVQYSKDKETWYDGGNFELERILRYYSLNITPEIAFSAGENLYLKWIPSGNASWNGGTTTGSNGQLHFAGGVAITDLTSPDSKASGNVYAEDFDRINGGVDYRHAGQTNGIEKLGQLGEIFGDSIENWTDEQKNGLSGSNVVERPGYVQIGYETYPGGNRNTGAGSTTNHVGSLVTPALENASGTITLSFKAMCYRSPFTGRASMSAAAQADVTDIVVNIKGAGSFDSASSVTSKTLSGISTSRFDLKTLHIYNSDTTTQIEFTSTAVSGKFTRWFLDDICVSK